MIDAYNRHHPEIIVPAVAAVVEVEMISMNLSRSYYGTYFWYYVVSFQRVVRIIEDG
jgi:hypothetical protein